MCAKGLSLQYCPGLRALPGRIEGAVQIDLVNLGLAAFPEGLEGLSYLRLARTPHLEWLPLPSGPRLDVDLIRLDGLKRIQGPKDGVVRNLLVTSCGRFQTLPDNLHVLGNLTLSHLPCLTRLPEGMVVGGDLRISHCPGLPTLPKGLSVGGCLDFQEG
jgi:hypothetical protein